ncbi:response regulator transcription factor [Thermoflexus sp.]|uniref:helix-turn-helix transcriptional regulator n=1 Tax=Thermoflexus sp. TaxID=1969742 RepID=UPI0025ECB60A|nr:response regulator transcription factor [Thermoflexus sp.]MCS7350073.1 response regulator transcription factor [Thermoflexus sp.]MCX7689437.1 response regulator transcription factor [Thermoflexus sp.]MDW8179522.1 response regulator transcription factor [Anaerolineae bacterium]
MIRAAVIAAVPALRAGLRAMLEASGEIQVVREAASPADLEPYPEIEVVVAVFEPATAHGLREWRSLGEEHALLFLVERAESIGPLLAFSPPVYGILPLEVSAETLWAAVRALREGLIVLSSAFHPLLFASGGPSGVEEEEAFGEELTPREIEVLRLLADGLANKEIAARMGISEHTVKFHVSSIYRKLGAANRAEAVRLGLRRGWIPL